MKGLFMQNDNKIIKNLKEICENTLKQAFRCGKTTALNTLYLIKQYETQQNQINELKNTIERQKIMIEKMKNCYNCKYYGEPYAPLDIKCNNCVDIKEYANWEFNDGQ